MTLITIRQQHVKQAENTELPLQNRIVNPMLLFQWLAVMTNHSTAK